MRYNLAVIILSLIFSSCENSKEFNGFTYPEGKYKALILSYDDGTIEDLELVELLNKNNLKGTFNLNSAYLGAIRGWPQQNGDTIFQKYVPRDSLNQIYANHEIAVHGAYHKDFIKISKAEIIEEVQTDLKVLKELTGRNIISMAYPFGNTNDTIAKFISSTNITNARTVADTYSFDLPNEFLIWNPTCHDSKVLEYADKYLKLNDQKLSLFYVWGHSWEFKDKKRWNSMTEFCNRIGKKEDIWSVGTGEYCEYLKALDKIEFDNGEIYNPTENLTVWVNLSNKVEKLKSGQRIKIKPGTYIGYK
ncbi:polysaccharide deacetylase family protein [Mangrovimonas sp. TPBH4]|uniref:polysaccharide deacetylase family protein n=1 Tax=Mangrovimonas sp. TPBH4 TaxID=1645914 RepID=UPI0006B50C0E|nr:polysaccharide deacetylase family protein [Mangrovimonas sp. TPBH4]